MTDYIPLFYLPELNNTAFTFCSVQASQIEPECRCIYVTPGEFTLQFNIIENNPIQLIAVNSNIFDAINQIVMHN